MPSIFQPIEFSLPKFDRLDPTYQTSKARIRYVGKDSAFLSAFIFSVEEKAFVLAHFARQNTFFFQKKKNAQNQRAKLLFFKMSQTSFI